MTITFLAIGLACNDTLIAKTLLVDQGKPNAQIIIAENTPRAVPVAARELQTYIQKISGATLPIVTTPSADIALNIYVGESEYTRSLGLDGSKLHHGAYRMASGKNWLALIGGDSDYVFKGPSPRSREEMDEATAAWDKITGHTFRLPYGFSPMRHYNAELNLWYLDEKGSINAVYAFLGDLGVRWYLPDELGEVVPEHKSIELPKVDKTVTPDFALRYPHSNKKFGTTREALWAMRMGWSPAGDLAGPYTLAAVAHGLSYIIGRPEFKGTHDDFYAMIGGERQVTNDNPSLCLMNQDLIDLNVAYVRAVFDTYDPWMISVHPLDGMISVCQCPLCAGMSTPERGKIGIASDYVWQYVDRVAREVYKTHPNKKIAALAYANYQLPPEKIDKLSPNVLVGLPSGRTFSHNNTKLTKEVMDARKLWLTKLPEGSKQVYQYEYLMDAKKGRRTEHLPVIVTHTLAQNIGSLKGIGIGEHVDLAREGNSLVSLGSNHINLLVMSKLWWNNDLDVDALMDDYYTNYYGPARKEMKAVVEYSEANWTLMPQDATKITRFFELLKFARDAVPADSVYAKRIALFDEYSRPLEALAKQQNAPRDDSIPPVLLRGPRPSITTEQMTIDGKLDEDPWLYVPGRSTPTGHLNLKDYKLSDLVTGEAPRNQTTFKVFWNEDALYMAIRCEDSDMANLKIGTQDNGDNAIWKGDLLELHLETQSHSYYAIVINPAGAVVDLDWKNKARDMDWNSNIKVATTRDDNGWTVELRIPVVSEIESDIVNFDGQGVVGSLPTRTFPWYMNLVRQRLREGDDEFTAYSPLGKKGFHDASKFARLSKAR